MSTNLSMCRGTIVLHVSLTLLTKRFNEFPSKEKEA